MLMKKAWLIIAILCVVMSPAYALDFSANFSIISNRISLNESAKFTIFITNNGPNDEFRIRNIAYPYWEVFTEPRINPITLKVVSGATKSIDLNIFPQYIKNIETYLVPLRLQSINTEEYVELPLPVAIQSTEKLISGYVPTVVIDVNMPKTIDPRQEQSIKVNINNQNSLDYPELNIILDSNLIKDEKTETLGPKEEKTIEFIKKLDSMTPPIKDELTVTIIGYNKTLEWVKMPFEIQEYFEKSEVVSKNFLRKETKIHAFSNNPDYLGVISYQTSAIKNIFTSTSPKVKMAQKGKEQYYEWNIQLNSDKSMDITITENYRSLLVLIFLILISVIVYAVTRNPIVITKSATNIKIREGGISELSVRLNIKNRGKDALDEVHITETTPSIVDIEKEISIGTLHPTKILRNEKLGSLIKWDIGKLDANEEKVITYKLRARLAILGELNLTPAKAKFKCRKKYWTAGSNPININPINSPEA